jgi:hypothetical protein
MDANLGIKRIFNEMPWSRVNRRGREGEDAEEKEKEGKKI